MNYVLYSLKCKCIVTLLFFLGVTLYLNSEPELQPGWLLPLSSSPLLAVFEHVFVRPLLELGQELRSHLVLDHMS